ncbi:MAG: T9SS type A sorting domain-containing protein [Saprospiraceae bacterium]|nr:T9SS type A sorting domain-containing protein [Saprospiraceae bacterium]
MKNRFVLTLLMAAFFLGLHAQSDFDPTAYKILFLTKDVTTDGVLEEQGIINDLRSRGFQVDITYNNAGSVTIPVDVEFSFDLMNDYDLVIIGRGVSSGDFTEIDAWAAVTTPIIHFSGYIVRNNRLNLMNTGTATREVTDASTVAMDRVANISITDNPIFTGLDSDGDGMIGYHTWFYDYVGYGADTFELNHNATMLGAWATGSAGDGNVAIAMWNAGVETYPGSGDTLAGARMYFQMGADDNSSPKVRNYTAFTDESTLLFHNAIKMLLGATPDGQIIPVQSNSLGKIAFITKDVDESGNLEEIEVISELRKRGYDVDVSYNNAGSITVPADFDFSYEALNNYDVVILGRGVSSGDFTDAEGWATVETPIIVFSSYLVRNSRLKLVNSGSATREVQDGLTVAMDRVAHVAIADNPLFTGVDTDMDGMIGYHTWFYDYVGYGADTFEMNHNATLLASWATDTSAGSGNVAIAYWDGGVEPYTDAGITLAGPRLYLQMGADDGSSPKLRNYTAFTEESWIVLFNALTWLSGGTPTGVLPQPGPVAYWNMDEGTDVVVKDVIANANGEIRNGNGITWESCGVNQSLNFGGATKSDAIVWVNDHPNVNFSGSQSFSISMLAKIDPYANTAEMNLLLKGDNKNDGTHLPNGTGKWYAVATKDGELRFALDDDVTKTQLGIPIDTTIFPANQWNHIVAVRDRDADVLRLYINGVMMGSLQDDTEEDISTTGLPLVIGNYHSGSRIINGGLDEIAIYDFALSDEEVSDLFAGMEITDDCAVVATITEASDDATLSALTISAGTLEPEFNPGITSYKATLPQGTASVTIDATANHPAATVAGAGEFTNVPGTATITVTAEDGSTKDYSISFFLEGVGNTKTVIEPGFETLWTAINAANDGDTLVLKNGETYTPLEAYTINKKIVIIAETIPTLPNLENQPIIENLFAVSPLFSLQFGANIHLIGIDVDNQGAANIFNTSDETGATMAVYVNRCRLHNSTDDIFDDAPDGGATMTRLTSCVMINSYIYDSGGGHGVYIKNFYGESEFRFENLTIWNLGEQFNWIRHYPAGTTQKYTYNHITGYNLSTDEADNKELFGNSDNPDAEANLDIELKNSIFHTQISANEGSLKFNNTSGAHNITINNNVLFMVAPIFDLGGTINKSANQIGVDPQYADPDNRDFTVMNSDLWAAADDGQIVGATYWMPDYVDDFSDLQTVSRNDINIERLQFGLFPNPTSTNVQVHFNLKHAGQVNINILDLTGRFVRTITNGVLAPGNHDVLADLSGLQPGLYLVQLRENGMNATRKLIKAQ